MLSQQERINQSLVDQGIPPNDLSQIIDSYYLGEKDGELNKKPKLPELSEYWRGYSYGNREYWLKKKGIKIPEDF